MQHINPFEDDNFARYVGIELLEVSDDGAQAILEVKEHHLNGYELVHGGALFTLAAWTFAVAANARGKMAVGINANISFIKAVRGGTLTAQAREISSSRKIATYAVNIMDDHGQSIATFQGMAYRKE